MAVTHSARELFAILARHEFDAWRTWLLEQFSNEYDKHVNGRQRPLVEWVREIRRKPELFLVVQEVEAARARGEQADGRRLEIATGWFNAWDRKYFDLGLYDMYQKDKHVERMAMLMHLVLAEPLPPPDVV